VQESLAQAEAGYYQALADQRSAVAYYDREIGTTLERFHVILRRSEKEGESEGESESESESEGESEDESALSRTLDRLDRT